MVTSARSLTMLAPLIILFLSCADESQEAERYSLDQERAAILLMAQQSVCTGDGGCRYIAFGRKACGGPHEYFVYSTSIDTALLQARVAEYNNREDAYNRKWNVLSDCSVPSPPDSLACINGKCVAFWH